MRPSNPLLGIPVLDVPFPQRVPAATRPPNQRPQDEPPRRILPSAQKTMVGMATDEEPLANRPTMPEAPMGKAGRTIVGLGMALAPAPTEEPNEVRRGAFEPSVSARDPELMAPESLRLPTRRVTPMDWAVLLGVLTFIVVLLAALL